VLVAELGQLGHLDRRGTSKSKILPMPGNLHPGDDVQRLIAERFLERIFLNEETAQPGSGLAPESVAGLASRRCGALCPANAV
jgi:hypothetical protein